MTLKGLEHSWMADFTPRQPRTRLQSELYALQETCGWQVKVPAIKPNHLSSALQTRMEKPLPQALPCACLGMRGSTSTTRPK